LKDEVNNRVKESKNKKLEEARTKRQELQNLRVKYSSEIEEYLEKCVKDAADEGSHKVYIDVNLVLGNSIRYRLQESDVKKFCNKHGFEYLEFSGKWDANDPETFNINTGIHSNRNNRGNDSNDSNQLFWIVLISIVIVILLWFLLL